MERNHKPVGQWGWAALAAYVIAFDVYAPETLSNAFKRGREHEIGRYVTAAATGYLVAHLYDLLPEEIDPIDTICRKAGQWKNNRNN